jgi:hypothetical protein
MSGSSKFLLAPAVIVALASISVDNSRAEQPGQALALIEVNVEGDSMEIVGSALALTAGQLSGEMIINRKGSAGSVSTRQGRELTLATGERIDIARVGISHRAGDQLSITVTLKRDGNVVAESTLNTGN